MEACSFAVAFNSDRTIGSSGVYHIRHPRTLARHPIFKVVEVRLGLDHSRACAYMRT